jgi:transposase
MGEMSMMKYRSICIECGEAFVYEIQNHGRPRKYCSAECGKAWRDKKASNTVKCRCCGKIFINRMGNHSRCCSKPCAVADIRRQAEERGNAGSNRKIREWAVSLCFGGYGYAATAEALGLSRSTLRYWSNQYKDYGSAAGGAMTARYSYRDAQNPGEWLETLRAVQGANEYGAPPITGGRRVFLVCGREAGKKGMDRLSAIVTARLKMNPYDGSVYVFCSGELDILYCLYWDGAGLTVVVRRCGYGKYPRPSPEVSRYMEVTPQDLSTIMAG